MSVKKKYVGNFRDLIVYRKSLIFRKDIYTLTTMMPYSERGIINALKKASCSACANLAEGSGNYYYGREYEHFDIAVCMLAKIQALLDFAFLQENAEKGLYDKLQNDSNEIVRMIRALMERIEGFLTNESLEYKGYPIKEVNSANLESIIERVKLFQRAIASMVKTLPDGETGNIVDQLKRAVSSVYENLIKPTNISDNRFKELNSSLGSLAEVRSFLDISVMENFITKEEYLKLDEEAGIIYFSLIDQMKELSNSLLVVL